MQEKEYLINYFSEWGKSEQSKAVLEADLYADPWTTRAIFRLLDPLAQQYVMRLLLTSYPHIEKEQVDCWATQSSQERHQAALNQLRHLRIFLMGKKKDETMVWGISKRFRTSMLTALASLNANLACPEHVTPPSPPTPSLLRQYALHRWERVLHLMVGVTFDPRAEVADSVEDGVAPFDEPHVRLMLSRLGLVRESRHAPIIADADGALSSAGAPGITPDGFCFLLQGTAMQVWRFLVEYVAYWEESHGVRPGDSLAFLFQMGFMTVGQPQYLGALTEHRRLIVRDLQQFGLVYMPQGSHWFYPTALLKAHSTSPAASTARPSDAAVPEAQRSVMPFASAASELDQEELPSTVGGAHMGSIILESNYKVYAYTTSTLFAYLITLFVHAQYRLPNLLVGTITSESIRNAFLKGISAQQIIAFLRQHAHPQMLARQQVLPEVVVDQILLWESERNRLHGVEAYLYEEFPTPHLFAETERFARQLGVLLYADPVRRLLIVAKQGHDAVKERLKQLIHNPLPL